MRIVRPVIWLTAAGALFAAATPARADKCTAVQLRLMGKKESRLLGCQSKVAATADSSRLGACEMKASDSFHFGFISIDACPASGTSANEAACENIADSCASSVAGAFIDTFPSKCEAIKRKAAGKFAGKELDCYATAAANGLAVDSGCITKATDKFSAALARAGSCPDGGSPRTYVEEHCVGPVFTTDGGGMVTAVCPTTTTTTTTTSTTTTTTLPRQTCGSYPTCGGSCSAGQTCVSLPVGSPGECLCFDENGCAASYPTCGGTCSGGTCTNVGSFCVCLGGGCTCGGSCSDPLYDCVDSGTKLGCACVSGQ